jgi:hypothetical protein
MISNDGLLGLALPGRTRRRSISAENPRGEPGAGGRATEGTGAHSARDLGTGWKVSPSVCLPGGQTAPGSSTTSG